MILKEGVHRQTDCLTAPSRMLLSALSILGPPCSWLSQDAETNRFWEMSTFVALHLQPSRPTCV
jgi:hypothetical protein